MKHTFLVIALVLLGWACSSPTNPESETKKIDPLTHWGENPWP